MSVKGKKNHAGTAVRMHGGLSLPGFLAGAFLTVCIGILLYGFCAYQFLDENGSPVQGTETSVSADGKPAVLNAQCTATGERDLVLGGTSVHLTEQTWQLDSGSTLRSVYASDEAFLESLPSEGWQPKLITGFQLCGKEAVCWEKGDSLLLSISTGNGAFVLYGEVPEQELYTAGQNTSFE